ncbi:MAG: hypothetical protein LBD25_02690 [Coriobacteriales bacterium]|jgi:hypothetical protein|nr:hypothetical protein [Coriobacteriales bacterium]
MAKSVSAKYTGLLVVVLATVALLITAYVATATSSASAAPSQPFTVKLPVEAEEAISVTLTDESDSTITVTDSIAVGSTSVTFTGFYDPDSSYTLTVTGMARYEDFSASGITGEYLDDYEITSLTLRTYSVATFVEPASGGSITPTVTDAPYGSGKTVTAVADPGFAIISFVVDKGAAGELVQAAAVGETTFEYSFTNITDDHTVHVAFADESGKVTFTFNEDDHMVAGGRPEILAFGGKISFARGGAAATFTVNADNEFTPGGSGANYHIVEVLIDGAPQTLTPPTINDRDSHRYSFPAPPPATSVNVEITFALDTYEVTVTRGADGSVKHEGSDVTAPIMVNYGETPAFDILPNPGYKFSVSLAPGGAVDDFQNATGDSSPLAYVLPVVRSDIAIQIDFNPIASARTPYHIEDLLAVTDPKLIDTSTPGLIAYYLPDDPAAQATLAPPSTYDAVGYDGSAHEGTYAFTGGSGGAVDITSGQIGIAKKRPSTDGWRDPVLITLAKPARIVFDGTRPTIDSIDISDPDWTNVSPLTIAVTASDPLCASGDRGSGVEKVVWSKGAPLTDDSARAETVNLARPTVGGWEFEVSGEHDDVTYYVYAVDAVGNVSGLPGTVSAKIDLTSPEIIEYCFGDALGDDTPFVSEFADPTVPKFGFYSNEDISAFIKVIDEGASSGFNSVSCTLVPIDPSSGSAIHLLPVAINSDGIAEIPLHSVITGDFKGSLVVEATDNVGNLSGSKTTLALVIENAPPVISIADDSTSSHHDAAGNELYVADTSFTVTVTDTGSGIRTIDYARSAEHESYSVEVVKPNEVFYAVGDELEDGWKVEKTEANLVTEVTKTFTISGDDNDIVYAFGARDGSGNEAETAQTKKVTIDTTPPVINVVFRPDAPLNENYYSANRVADIVVTERNFDPELIKAAIENSYGPVPSLSAFTDASNTLHRAVINFGEGDYTFDISGKDRGDHTATVSFSGGNEKLFFVDTSAPYILENFFEFQRNNQSFQNENNSFNVEKTVFIRIAEHNFDPESTNLVVMRKDAGEPHDTAGFTDATDEVAGGRWEESGDVHTITFDVSRDAVYQISIAPVDLAGNAGDNRSTAVFEIDLTAPIVTEKNGSYVSEDDIEFLDIYPYERRDEPVPSVEFEDKNIDHINYALMVYIPDHTSASATTVINPVQVFLDEDKNHSGVIQGSKIALPEFAEDGVYALVLVAVDVAGNESLMNLNTYAKMIDQDVLAYIIDSNLNTGTGLYSFQYENGEAISKRPNSFSDVKIVVLAKKDTGVDIVLRDNNGDEINTRTVPQVNNEVFGVTVSNFVLESEYFKENFQEDTDALFHLSAKNEGKRLDLGTMHIDNIAPTCELPAEFNSWQWYFGGEAQTITVSNIDEPLNEGLCKVYDNGSEIPFAYSRADNTVSFTLSEGWHNVGIVLSDMAGNTSNIQERAQIHVGYFWLWAMSAALLVLVALAAFLIVRHRIKRRKLEEDWG